MPPVDPNPERLISQSSDWLRFILSSGMDMFPQVVNGISALGIPKLSPNSFYSHGRDFMAVQTAQLV